MIECIFTIDYEIYGNGQGSLAELVFEPARKLKRVFDQAGAKFVLYVEAAELEKIAAARTDLAIDDVQRQVRDFHEQGFEVALHLHPQWYNATYENGGWLLDYGEYNLCELSKTRITELVDRSIAYLRKILGNPLFTPLAFRAGNWLFQPTATAAEVLFERGIKLDSSVFKGGLQHATHLDYRSAVSNGYSWKFQRDVNTPDSWGTLLEIPIYTRMVPLWRMLTGKRVSLQRKGDAAAHKTVRHKGARKMNRLRDYIRFRYPQKFDFCRMTLEEMVEVTEDAIQEDRKTPDLASRWLLLATRRIWSISRQSKRFWTS